MLELYPQENVRIKKFRFDVMIILNYCNKVRNWATCNRKGFYTSERRDFG